MTQTAARRGPPITIIVGTAAVAIAAEELYEHLDQAAQANITSAERLSSFLSTVYGTPVTVPPETWAVLVDDYGEYFQRFIEALGPWSWLADWFRGLFE